MAFHWLLKTSIKPAVSLSGYHYTFKVEALDDAYDTAKTTNNIRQMAYTDGIKFMFYLPD